MRSRFGQGRIAWLHLNGHCCVGFEPYCPIDRVICTDFGCEFELISAQTTIQFLSLERLTGRRSVASDTNIERLLPALGGRIRNDLHAAGGRWTLVCPFACRGLHELGESAGWPVVSPDPGLAGDLGDKTSLHQALKHLGLPRPAGRWLRIASARYDELSREFGPRLVLQKRRGSGGSGTAIVGSREEMHQAVGRFGQGTAYVARFVGERSLNINAVATPLGVAVSWPNLQLVGLPEVNALPGQYTGNDYTAAMQLPRAWIEDVIEQTERLGRWAAARGHHGLFGLDFVLEEATGRAYAVDFNPRWQGSTALLTQAELHANRTPLAVLELAYGMGVIPAAELLRRAAGPRPLAGSQLSVHLRGPDTVGLKSQLHPGIVSVNATLSTNRPALRLSDLASRQEVLLSGGVPTEGTLIDPGATVLKLLDTQAAVDAETQHLTPKSRQVVEQIYEHLGRKARPAGVSAGA